MHKFPEGRNQRSAVIGAQFLSNRNGFMLSPVYLVASALLVEEASPLSFYNKSVIPFFTGYGAEVLVVGRTEQLVEHLEGEWKPGSDFILFRFSSMDALDKCLNSAEYRALKYLQTEIVSKRLFLSLIV